MSERDVVRIGNARGLIAVYLDETEAIDLAGLYGVRDAAYSEIMDAVEKAYPPEPEDDPRPGLTIGISMRAPKEDS